MKTEKEIWFENRQRLLFNNLLATPPSASNCMASMAHAMGLEFTGAIFVTMSEGIQFDNRLTKQG